jgi:hypothetical protein
MQVLRSCWCCLFSVLKNGKWTSLAVVITCEVVGAYSHQKSIKIALEFPACSIVPGISEHTSQLHILYTYLLLTHLKIHLGYCSSPKAVHTQPHPSTYGSSCSSCSSATPHIYDAQFISKQPRHMSHHNIIISKDPK